ncbi:MAG: hypothetical protein ACM3X7_08985 [Solirubrobacterales bacterium]
MVMMDEKALNFVKGKNLCFVAGVKKTQVNCDCGGCNSNVQTLKIKVLFETEVLDKFLYDIFEYQGTKVFVLKSLKVTGDINVYQKFKFPFMEPKFGINGITA